MSKYNKDLKVGDIIYATSGQIHQVTDIQGRHHGGQEYNSLIFYRTILEVDGSLCKSKEVHCCDASFCRKVTKDEIRVKFEDDLNALNEKYETILNLMGLESSITRIAERQ